LADDGALPSPALMIIGRVVTGETIEAAQEFWINTALGDGADRDTRSEISRMKSNSQRSEHDFTS
jgi:hypothetical protein